jgi:rare lipoprotein A
MITSAIVLGSLHTSAQGEDKSILSSIKKGLASFYHDKFEGKKTATGEVFDNDQYTAACNSLKLGTYAKVTNLSNGEVVYVRVNDRMAAKSSRVIDLAVVAAKKLNFQHKGIADVKVEVVGSEEGRRAILAQNGAAAGNSEL